MIETNNIIIYIYRQASNITTDRKKTGLVMIIVNYGQDYHHHHYQQTTVQTKPVKITRKPGRHYYTT